jgi:hypothetical protein
MFSVQTAPLRGFEAQRNQGLATLHFIRGMWRWLTASSADDVWEAGEHLRLAVIYALIYRKELKRCHQAS